MSFDDIMEIMVQHVYCKEHSIDIYNSICNLHTTLLNPKKCSKSKEYQSILFRINTKYLEIQKLKDIKDIVTYVAMNKFNLIHIDHFNEFLIANSKINLTRKRKNELLRDIYAVFYGECIVSVLKQITPTVDVCDDEKRDGIYAISLDFDLNEYFLNVMNYREQGVSSEDIIEMEEVN